MYISWEQVVSDHPESHRHQAQLPFHSLVNLLNIIKSSLKRFEQAQKRKLFSASYNACHHCIRNIHQESDVLAAVIPVQATISADLQALAGEHDKFCEHIMIYPHLLSAHVAELATVAEGWRTYAKEAVRGELTAVLDAMVLYSGGRFQVLFDEVVGDASNTYYIHLDLQGATSTMYLHPYLKTVLRDLIANARKYSPPRTKIHAQLVQSRETVTLSVTDQGRGIPELEIPYVFRYGYRASNVQDVKTYGGGYGLTKTLWVTHLLGGRLQIQSSINCGTQIEVVVPVPVPPVASL